MDLLQQSEALAAELTHIVAMRDVLAEEQKCLIKSDMEQLPIITAKKNEIAAKLADSAKTRNENIEICGFQKNSVGTERWVEHLATRKVQARQTWKSILSVAAESRELNRVNGLLLSKLQSLNAQAITALQQPGKKQALYGPNGQKNTGSASRTLIIG